MAKRQICVQVDEEGTFGDLFDKPQKLAKVRKRWDKAFENKTAMQMLDSAHKKSVKA